MKDIRIAAGMSEGFDYGKVTAIMKEALDAGCDIVHSDAVDMYEMKDYQLMGGHNIIYYIRKITDKPIECHFYTQECDLLFIEKMAFVGCTMLILPADRFIGSQLSDVMKWCRQKNIKVGLTVGSYVPLSLVEDAIYDIDRLHIMTNVNDEEGNYRPSSINMIKRARKLIDECNPKCELSVEGGIRPENVDEIVAAQPDIIVFSAAIYNDPEGITAGVKKCRDAIDKAIAKCEH